MCKQKRELNGSFVLKQKLKSKLLSLKTICKCFSLVQLQREKKTTLAYPKIYNRGDAKKKYENDTYTMQCRKNESRFHYLCLQVNTQDYSKFKAYG